MSAEPELGDQPKGSTTVSAEQAKPAPKYRTELTDAGEQFVISGCELDAAPACKQLDLF